LLQIIQRLPGAADARLEQADGLPLLSIEPERDHLALLNIDVASLQQSIQTAVGGRSVGVVYQGDRPIQLVLRLAGHERRDPQTLAQLPVLLPASGEQELNYVPLGEIARIRELTGPNQINRQNGKRHVVLSVNVQDRDLGSFVADLQQQLAGSRLPDGYWLEIGGTYEQLQSAQQRLQWVVPLTLLLIFLLLCSALKSLRDATLVFSGIPLALVGGVLALSLRDMPLSISAAVGFIALSGIAVLNGIVLTSAIRSLQHSGHDLSSAIRLGAQSRLRPVLMTALVASLGFIPMAFNTGTGAEVQRPLATVVIGGVLSSTLLTLLVLPALLNQFSKTTRCNANHFASNLTGSADHNGIR
jgi:cobalt-zinc-cadmium resistance protein CzcA